MMMQMSLSLPLFHLLLINLGIVMVFGVDMFSRNDFPPDFVFGSGTSAYQVEGAAFEDGRTPSIWDTFTHAGRENGVTGDIACDGYHKYKEDVQLMVDTSLEAYRFSISWSRLIPSGRGPVNPKGLQYYNNLINELVSHGIQPHVTLFHFDLPQVLEDEYGGWLSKKSVKDFVVYADVCFREFGDRVLHWTTFNQANAMSFAGYDLGLSPPARCSSPFGRNCTIGNSSIEPYIVAHNILLAHASAARLYQKKYKVTQHGFIGLSLYASGFIPYTNGMEDVIATQRAKDFYLGWFVNPLVFGDYPHIMKKNAGTRIPVFTKHESKLVKGSFDFIGLIHYTSSYIKDESSKLEMDNRDFTADMAVEMIIMQGDTATLKLAIYPRGLQEVLNYFKHVYGNPAIYIHENGQMLQRNGTLNDKPRVEYLHGFIGGLLDAIRNGSNARGYFTWSFLDLFESRGYDTSFGLFYVDLDSKDLNRYPKLSAHWYSNFLKGGSIGPDTVFELEKNFSAASQSRFFE